MDYEILGAKGNGNTYELIEYASTKQSAMKRYKEIEKQWKDNDTEVSEYDFISLVLVLK